MALGGEDFMSDDIDFRNLLADVPPIVRLSSQSDKADEQVVN
jgi:hypothetical protein